MDDAGISDLKILIVDDQPANVLLIKSILERSGYSNLHNLTDSRAVGAWVLENQPDLVVLDLHMPQQDGFEVMEELRQILEVDDHLPVLVITADATQEVKRRALNGGAADYLTKPFDHIEVRLRIKNLLQARSLHRRLSAYNVKLEEIVRERTRQLEAAHLQILERLALAAEYRDDATGRHTQRVGRLSMLVARELSLSNNFVSLIERAAPLHDVGKIGIPDSILLKPDRLDENEWGLMQAHTTIGARLLAGSDDPLLHLAEEIALSHHERWDGQGYPDGITEDEIAVEAQIVAVTDVFDALTHQRPYKPAWTVDAALSEIESQRGRQFAPHVVDAFLEVVASNSLHTSDGGGSWTSTSWTGKYS